ADSYAIHRGTAAGAESSTAVDSVAQPASATTVTWIDPSAQSGAVQFYVVRSVKGAGASLWSSETSAQLTNLGAPQTIMLGGTDQSTSIAFGDLDRDGRAD